MRAPIQEATQVTSLPQEHEPVRAEQRWSPEMQDAPALQERPEVGAAGVRVRWRVRLLGLEVM